MMGGVNHMKPLFAVIFLLISVSSFAQKSQLEKDTLQKEINVMLYLDNGFAIPPFAVSGDIYLTNELFIFHPKHYRKKRFDMYNNLVKDILLPYDSILKVKRQGAFNLKLKTRAAKYKISYGNNWGKNLKATIELIELKKDHN